MSQKQAVITLIEKKGRNKRYIKNWINISLLNVDVKIISKILATHLTKNNFTTDFKRSDSLCSRQINWRISKTYF